MLTHAKDSGKLPNSHRCFVCGDQNAAGLHARFHTDGEKVWTTFTPGEQHMGYAGITHGGILAALLDETMGWAPAAALGRFCMAVELTVQYRKSVPIGTELTIVGWMTDGTRRIWEGRGEVRGPDGTVYVRGRGRFVPLTPEQTADVSQYLIYDVGTIPRERFGAAG